jgi:hypothetical protein
MPQRTPEGKWRVYDKETGAYLDRWPIDARGLLATGDYVDEPPEGSEPAPQATPEQRGIVEGEGTPLIPGRDLEQKSREGTLEAGDVPPDAQKAEDAPPAEPMAEPKKTSGKKKG